MHSNSLFDALAARPTTQLVIHDMFCACVNFTLKIRFTAQKNKIRKKTCPYNTVVHTLRWNHYREEWWSDACTTYTACARVA